MIRDDAIYDLGEVEFDKPPASFGAIPVVPRPESVRHETQPESVGVGPGLAGSLSMFVPGLGQMLTGEIAWGLFYLSGMGFCAASLWALVVTLDRLVPTLRLLDVPSDVLVVAFSSLAFLAAGLHLAAVLHTQARATWVGDRTAPHPMVAALASLAIPGWGQLLSSHRRRAVLFLGGLWFLSMGWLLVTPAGTRALSRLSLTLPVSLRDEWGPVLMVSAPIVLWVIAVYDAAAGAVAERHR